jgi:hypothetical protein
MLTRLANSALNFAEKAFPSIIVLTAVSLLNSVQ